MLVTNSLERLSRIYSLNRKQGISMAETTSTVNALIAVVKGSSGKMVAVWEADTSFRIQLNSDCSGRIKECEKIGGLPRRQSL
jgi:hypothetical protein